jgi:hypothetical protein
MNEMLAEIIVRKPKTAARSFGVLSIFLFLLFPVQSPAQLTNSSASNDRQIAEFDYTQRSRALPDDGKPTVKGTQLALDDIAKDNPKAKSLTVQQLVDSSFLP